MMETKLVLLGTGTPNACPDASGPSSAVVVGDRAYLVDFGPGVVRQAAKAYRNGIDALRPDRLVTAFCTHLHTDHTAGYPDLIFTPWVLERKEPLRVFGPKVGHRIHTLYRADGDHQAKQRSCLQWYRR